MERMRMRAWNLALAAVAVLSATAAVAVSDPPRENHYKNYSIALPLNQYARPIAMTDQFGTVEFTSGLLLSEILLPAEKILPTGERFPIVDPVTHLLFWTNGTGFAIPQPARTVVVIDQFGAEQWTTDDAIGFMNPAIKNVASGQPPIWNHYLCYFAFGPNPDRLVTLVDQFGSHQVLVRGGINILCNPAQKRHLDDGTVYPVVDPTAHLACYTNAFADVMAHTVVAIDQFGNWQFETDFSEWMCVPAIKEHVVRTQESTWGKIKALYR